jgi:molybdate transport system substrate-binding protein
MVVEAFMAMRRREAGALTQQRTGDSGMASRIKVISSMATRQVLADLVELFQRHSAQAVAVESVGGVDAARRVRAGEAFDVVVLASDAIEQLIAGGQIVAGSLGYSTGPSGVHLAKLFERWGIADAIRERIVKAPPGVPVGSLVADGKVELGFQQLSELMHLPGIDVLGPLPAPIQIITTFSAGLSATSTQPEAVQAMLDFMISPAAAEAKRRNGMEPA